MKQVLSFFSGVILGSLVGASVALLLTPTSGDNLRSDIQNRYIELKSEMQQAAEARRVELEEQLATMRKPSKPEA